jgi:hypothetical protein
MVTKNTATPLPKIYIYIDNRLSTEVQPISETYSYPIRLQDLNQLILKHLITRNKCYLSRYNICISKNKYQGKCGCKIVKNAFGKYVKLVEIEVHVSTLVYNSRKG